MQPIVPSLHAPATFQPCQVEDEKIQDNSIKRDARSETTSSLFDKITKNSGFNYRKHVFQAKLHLQDTPKVREISKQVNTETKRISRIIDQRIQGTAEGASQQIQGITERANQEIERVTTDASQQIQGITERANQEIERVTTNANQQIQGITERANQEIERVTTNANQQIQGITTDASQQIERVTTNANQQIQRITTDASQQIERVTTNASQWSQTFIKNANEKIQASTANGSNLMRKVIQDNPDTQREIMNTCSQIKNDMYTTNDKIKKMDSHPNSQIEQMNKQVERQIEEIHLKAKEQISSIKESANIETDTIVAETMEVIQRLINQTSAPAHLIKKTVFPKLPKTLSTEGCIFWQNQLNHITKTDLIFVRNDTVPTNQILDTITTASGRIGKVYQKAKCNEHHIQFKKCSELSSLDYQTTNMLHQGDCNDDERPSSRKSQSRANSNPYRATILRRVLRSNFK